MISLERATRSLTAGLGGLALLLLAIHGLAQAALPIQLDYGEGTMIHLADVWARGGPLYRDPQEYPWLACPYTPLQVVLLASLHELFGVGFGPGRVLSTLCALGCAWLVSGALAGPDGPRRAWTGAALFACSPLVVAWCGLVRVDFMALLLELAGLRVVEGMMGEQKLPPRRLLLSALLFVLAFYTKQSFVAGLAASTLALAGRHGLRSLWLPLTATALALPAWLALDASSGGRLSTILFRFNALPWSSEQAGLLLGQYLPLAVLPAAVALGWLARGNLRASDPWGWYLLVGLPLLLGVGRVGAWYNYFLPLHAALAVIGGRALREGSGRWLPVAALVCALVGWALPLRPTMPPLWEVACREIPIVVGGRLPAQVARSRQEVADYAASLQAGPGPVLAEEIGLPAILGRPAALCDPITLFTLADMGLWDESPLDAMVARRAFGVVVIQRPDEHNRRIPPRVMRRILEAYEPVRKVGPDWFLLPKRVP